MFSSPSVLLNLSNTSLIIQTNLGQNHKTKFESEIVKLLQGYRKGMRAERTQHVQEYMYTPSCIRMFTLKMCSRKGYILQCNAQKNSQQVPFRRASTQLTIIQSSRSRHQADRLNHCAAMEKIKIKIKIASTLRT